jgi:very-long-chain (3R)-3-hydroxyacyl-CoA dehydratase
MLIRGYLIIYNALSALAWFFLLINLAKSFFIDNLHNPDVLFQRTGQYLAYLQAVALLEVLHSALGWVRSGVISNVIQIAARLFVIWVAVVYGGSGNHWAYGMMAFAWALSDFTRYTYYLTQLTETSAPFLKWARYNFFLVLYPVGTLCETILIYLARLKWAKNLALSYGLLTVLAVYTPGKKTLNVINTSYLYSLGFFYMYSHMLQQRAKHFSTEHHHSSQSQEASVPSKQFKNKVK